MSTETGRPAAPPPKPNRPEARYRSVERGDQRRMVGLAGKPRRMVEFAGPHATDVWRSLHPTT